VLDIVRLRRDASGEDAAVSGQVTYKSGYQRKGRSLERRTLKNNHYYDDWGEQALFANRNENKRKKKKVNPNFPRKVRLSHAERLVRQMPLLSLMENLGMPPY
jgi:hypothetical protein